MKIQIYRATATQNVHIRAIEQFYTGIKNYEPDAELVKSNTVDTTADAYVFFGSWKDRKRSWHQIKMKILETGKPFIVMETPIIGRQIINDHPYYRIGVNHYVRHLGKFNNAVGDMQRWNTMQHDLGVEIYPWRTEGHYILLCLQIPGDASLLGEDITSWALQTIREIRQYTDRKIRVRPHPVKREYDEDIVEIIRNQPEVEWVDPGKQLPLAEDLEHAWATVTYTSGVGVDSILRGVPVVGCHPGNFAYDISSPIERIENPEVYDRDTWLSQISLVQWSLNEIEQGLPFEHLKSMLYSE